MNRRATVTTLATLTVGVAGLTPALAAPSGLSGKTIRGNFAYTDMTVDPTPSVLSSAEKREGFCVGTVPASPSDVNVHTVKVAAAGTLNVVGKHTGDWAMEIRDSKNHLIGGTDGDLPQVQEGTIVTLRKAGTYKVVYCNLGGAPTASAKYSFRYR
jgi:hypothetical protein